MQIKSPPKKSFKKKKFSTSNELLWKHTAANMGLNEKKFLICLFFIGKNFSSLSPEPVMCHFKTHAYVQCGTIHFASLIIQIQD